MSTNYVITGPMNLPVPTVGTELGPYYANDINSCMAIISQHDHSSGEGNQITPSGLNINTALSFNGNAASNLGYAAFTPQPSTLPGTSPTLSSLYAVGSSLYYNDSLGNQVPVVVNGSVPGATGTITGLPSTPPGAGASYNSTAETFTFISAATVPAALDSGPITIRDLIANSHGVTLNAPVSLPNSYSLTLPNIPSLLLPVTLDNAGNFGAQLINNSLILPATILNTAIAPATILGSNIASRTISTTNIAPVNFQASSSCGYFITSSTSLQQVTNFNTSITTLGNPVRVELSPDGSSINSVIELLNVSEYSPYGPNGTMYIQIQRNGFAIYNTTLNACYVGQPPLSFASPASLISFTDYGLNGAPGTYSYVMYVCVNSPSWNAVVSYCTLLAYEIR